MLTRNLIAFGILALTALHARAAVIINEIHYDPNVKTELVEFVELHNTGSGVASLSGWRLSDAVDYEFPDTAAIQPGGFLVISGDPAAVEAKFRGVSLGPWSGKLSNEGERIVLRNASDEVADEVEYQLGFPWPTVGDAPGYSIELIHPSLDNNLGGSWRRSVKGDPGSPSQDLIPAGSNWRYRKGVSEPSQPASGWRSRTFDDSSWSSGNLPIGYGENFIQTRLDDMPGGYSSVYLRKTFNVANPSAISELVLEAQYDDGFIVWINGTLVRQANMPGSEVPFSGSANSALESFAYETFTLPPPSQYLVQGQNVIAIQAHNSSLSGSSDFFMDARLLAQVGGSASRGPTPWAKNSVYAETAPPQIRQVAHAPEQPRSGEAVLITAKVTDPDGMGEVTLSLQTVAPGSYIDLADAAYQTSWITLPMNDAGENGDALAGDGIYSALAPAAAHRTLVRYRISAADQASAAITAPYADDPQPNFAYFVYDGVPAWSGAIQPNSADPARNTRVAFGTDVMRRLPVYHLIAKNQSVENSTWNEQYGGDLYKWGGALVYDGKVYDHIRYRARGGVWRYAMGKNMWKFDFNRGHSFEPRDNFGRKYSVAWNKLNLGACIQQGDYLHRGEQGMFESVGFRLFNLAGVESPLTHFIQFRIIDNAAESNPNSQYDGDFWGLYLAIEQEDGKFLDAHDLPDGNLYKMEGGTGTLNNQGPTAATDRSDLNAFMSGYRSGPPDIWFRTNMSLIRYYSYRTIVEAIHHYDIDEGAGKNYFFYRNPETGQWSTHAWDLDLTWADNMYGGGEEPFKNRVLSPSRAAFNIEYDNRIREIRDLLFNTDQAFQLIDEHAAMISSAAGPSMVDADRAQWDYHPIMASGRVNPSKAGQGRFYQRAATKNFAGMVSIMKNYVNTRGAFLDNLSQDNSIPSRPVVTSESPANFPINRLRFRSSAYAGANPYAATQWRIGEITPPGRPAFDPLVPRAYEIEPVWQSEEIAAAPGEITIPGEALKAGKTYRVRARAKDITGRWSRWSAPVEFMAGQADNAAALVDNLRLTELMYDPAGGSQNEFVELRNTSDSLTLDLSGVSFTQGITYSFPPGASLPPGGFLLVVQASAASNFAAFRTHYGLSADVPIYGPYSGSLNNDGEDIALKTSAGGPDIVSFEYLDSRGWPVAAGGAGHSLAPLASSYPDQNSGALNYGGNWRASSYLGGSPGAADPEPAAGVVINEVLAHSDFFDAARPEYDSNDWIELYNPTAAPVDLGGLYLSDDPANLKKWQIPAGTEILPRGWISFDEISGFHNPISIGFGLDKAGERVFLSELPATGKGRVIDAVAFKGQPNEVSLGRWPDGGAWRALEPSRQAANLAPASPSLLISELMYHPAPTPAKPEDNTLDEYVEIANHGPGPANLYDTNGVFRLDGRVQFLFPASVTLPGGGHLLVVSFNPTNAAALASFRETYEVAASVPIFGPYIGTLKNSSDRVALERPQAPDQPGDLFSWIIVDEVFYGDQNPWPRQADGQGSSLHRVATSGGLGTIASDWAARDPSPGAGETSSGDSDGDGLPDAWELANGLNPSSAADAALDTDGDGFTNLAEFLAGTNPSDPQSALRWESVLISNGRASLVFQAAAGKAYRVEYRDDLGAGDWQPLQEIAASPSARTVEVTDNNSAAAGARFYRLAALP